MARDEDRILIEGAADADDDADGLRFREPKVTDGIKDADDGCAADADDGCSNIDEDRILLEGAADTDRIPCGRAAEVSGTIGYGDGGGLDEVCQDGYSEGSNGWFIPYCSLKLGEYCWDRG